MKLCGFEDFINANASVILHQFKVVRVWNGMCISYLECDIVTMVYLKQDGVGPVDNRPSTG